jgi:putative acetyltransferase
MSGEPFNPERLRIRRAEPSDYAGFAEVLSGPKAIAGTLQLPIPSIERWRERLAKTDPESFVIVAEMRSTNSSTEFFEIVGHLGLFPTSSSSSPRRRHAVALGLSVRDDWQGRGIGHALLTTALDRADNWMNVLRIELTVFADNASAVALYQRHGFVVEGTHRAYALRDGAYVDAHAMARLHPRPPMLPAAIVE